MSVVSKIRSWWRALANRRRLEAEMESELGFHIESRAAELVRQGRGWQEALRQARMELGSVAVQKEEVRRSIGLRPWDDLRSDIRYAFRQLRNAPGFTTTVVLVLALGIGANAAMFSVLDATLLRWLPFDRPSQLVGLGVTDQKGTWAWASYADFEEWQKQTQTVSPIAAYSRNSLYLKSAGEDQMVSATQVTSSFFPTLGVQPAMGRAFTADEQVEGRGKAVVLSDRVWRHRFLADPEILNKQISLNDTPYTVVGVMPPGFSFPVDDPTEQIWVPLEVTAKHHLRDFSTAPYEVIGRMRPGITPKAVAAELTGIQKRLVPLYSAGLGAEFAPAGVTATPYRDTLVQNSRSALLGLMMAVAILWLIACANVANLMLARGMARQREIAVRGALGASRWRLVRQLFTESLLLSLLGSAVGLGLAQAAIHVFDKALAARLKLTEPLSPNPTVLVALLGLSVLSSILFGLLPAWLAARTPIDQALRQGPNQAGTSRNRHRLQQGMVVAEIGLSLVLLVACGLLLRTVFALRKVPLGFRTDHVLLVQPTVPKYKYRNVDLNRAVYQPLLDRIQHMNGVESASLTTVLPLHKGFDMYMTLFVSQGEKSSTPPTRIDAKMRAASAGLQDVLGFRMYKGRYFNQQDTPDSPPVAVVNRAFARLYAKDENVIGRFSLTVGKDREAKVVGIMDDFHQASVGEPSAPEIQLCSEQMKPTDSFYQPTLLAHMELAVRTVNDPAKFIPDMRAAMAQINPDLKASSFTTMDQVVEDSLGSQLLAARLLEIFGGAALFVALAGLYGLLSYLVAQRTPELGVRLALGAQRGMIVQLVLKQAGWMLLTGAAAGVLLAYFFSQMIATFLYGVKPRDVWTLLSVAVLLLVSGVVAAWLPARRASRVDPMIALRTS